MLPFVGSVSDTGETKEVSIPKNVRPLHRLGTVRRTQGISRRTMARLLNVDMREVRRQEAETCDLPLSQLYAWREVLRVPIGELLVEPQDGLATPLLKRAQLVRIMKTVAAICEQASDPRIRTMAQTLAGQLIDIMPELEKVGAWHTIGWRRGEHELGVIAERPVSDDVFRRFD